MDESVKTRHETVECVATSRFRQTAFRNSVICLLKKGICDVGFPVFINLDELMLGGIVIVEIPQEVCGQSLKSDLLPRINLVSFERPENDIVLSFPVMGDVLGLYKAFERLEKIVLFRVTSKRNLAC